MRSISTYIFLLLLASLLAACNADKEYAELGEAKGCDTAQSSCMVKQGNMAVSLTLGPHVVPLKPFKALVTIEGVMVDRNSVIVDYQMKGMDMGMNRYRLIAGKGSWSGTATLPVCSASRMDWYALVEFSSDGKKYRARFPFQTVSQP